MKTYRDIVPSIFVDPGEDPNWISRPYIESLSTFHDDTIRPAIDSLGFLLEPEVTDMIDIMLLAIGNSYDTTQLLQSVTVPFTVGTDAQNYVFYINKPNIIGSDIELLVETGLTLTGGIQTFKATLSSASGALGSRLTVLVDEVGAGTDDFEFYLVDTVAGTFSVLIEAGTNVDDGGRVTFKVTLLNDGVAVTGEVYDDLSLSFDDSRYFASILGGQNTGSLRAQDNTSTLDAAWNASKMPTAGTYQIAAGNVIEIYDNLSVDLDAAPPFSYPTFLDVLNAVDNEGMLRTRILLPLSAAPTYPDMLPDNGTYMFPATSKMREFASTIQELYKKKGTREGIIEAIRFLCGEEVTILDAQNDFGGGVWELGSFAPLVANEVPTAVLLEVLNTDIFSAGDQIYLGGEYHTIDVGGVDPGVSITIESPGLAGAHSIGDPVYLVTAELGVGTILGPGEELISLFTFIVVLQDCLWTSGPGPASMFPTADGLALRDKIEDVIQKTKPGWTRHILRDCGKYFLDLTDSFGGPEWIS